MNKLIRAAFPIHKPEPRVTRPKRNLSLEVDLELFAAALDEADRLDWSIRQCVEWGFKLFLLTTNPKRAKELGIEV